MSDYIARWLATETMVLEDVLGMLDLALEYVSGKDDHIPEMLVEEAMVPDEYLVVFEKAVEILREVNP